MVEVQVLVVRVDLAGSPPVVVLREVAGEGRVLPIYIGPAEAQSIEFALQEVELPRPMTHDLLMSVIGELGGVLERVTIVEVVGGTFHAELTVRVGAAEHRISSRSSDAIALALRAGCPIEVADEVIDTAGVVPDDEDDGELVELDDSSDLEAFREFIENVDPEDFLR